MDFHLFFVSNVVMRKGQKFKKRKEKVRSTMAIVVATRVPSGKGQKEE